MPSSSKSQAALMAGIAHGWKPTGMKHPPSVKVAQEFNNADRRVHAKAQQKALKEMR